MEKQQDLKKETKKEINETTIVNNNVIIDLKLKMDKLNYLLTFLFDFNNAFLYDKQLIAPKFHEQLVNDLIAHIGKFSDIVKQVDIISKQEKPENGESETKQNEN